MRKIRQLALVALAACVAAAVAFASGEDEAGSQGSAAAEMMSEYGDVWQWDTLADFERDTGQTITSFGEAPMLAAMVAAGELPPVEERLPEEPLVFNVFEGIGTYGGTLKVASIGTEYTELTPIRGLAGAVQTANRGPGHAIDIVPYVHKGWEMSEDQKTVTMYLRRGVKWSDGPPLHTADDVMFAFEDFLLIDEFPSGWHRSGWGPMSHAEKVDDFTVRLHYTDPFPTLPGWYEFWGGWQPHSYPKHYLSKYHAKYNENADALAKEEGYDNWVQAVWQKQASTSDFRVGDLNTPSVNPWNHEEITTTYVLHVRNPYHFAIDPVGNQLPYIDRLRVETVADAETLNLKVISGELSVAAIGLSTPDFPLFKENEESGDYQTLMWPRAPRGRRASMPSTSRTRTRSSARSSRTCASGRRCRWRSTARRSTRCCFSGWRFRGRRRWTRRIPSTRRSGPPATRSTTPIPPTGCSTKWPCSAAATGFACAPTARC